ncbi:hypothetical protein N7509_005344 [Penicillium cosmopolitanum]|uniref:Ubiquitin carboxyl-terminal hydrolase n=1 Tax=Penicillium cosmopolitanum TaxID=1131564 RepID=A0A9X0B9Y3_9EURO|nr:uncharacterized protein N7509_005344 [Penicillium cosmopolitanum]KAJ5397231.1 hypothetical protein N7509_005344 [Penicillium cosmopolitanum]
MVLIMGPPSKRQRRSNSTECSSDNICQPATHLEKDSWNGFCEIESEPALFNVMLREFGVKGVKVQEVVSLDEELMAFLNQPIYGLIFLFRWREDDAEKQEASCPDGLWFANQTASNACASVALLNIVNNIPDVDLGENLQQFKEFTMPFTPALRGDAINNFEFVKRVHNSFARKMDILNSDLQLKGEATSSKRSQKQISGDEDATFHFIAFMPAMGQVWKLDGLERQPQAIGECSEEEDWLELARPNILDRMAAYEEEQIEFSILGLVRDPLPGLIQELAVNVRSLEVINERLMASGATDAGADSSMETSQSLEALQETVFGPEPFFGLTRAMIDEAVIPEVLPEEDSPSSLIEKREELRQAQIALRGRVREEKEAQDADDDHATGRRYDYGPAIRTWLRCLARKQELADLLS